MICPHKEMSHVYPQLSLVH